MFKICPNCNHEWKTREDFLSDANVSVVGYQVNYMNLESGLFMFNHDTEECGTTMTLDVKYFSDMHNGPLFEEHTKENAENCPGYCEDRYILEPCDAKCECAYVRDVLQKVKNWPKQQLA